MNKYHFPCHVETHTYSDCFLSCCEAGSCVNVTQPSQDLKVGVRFFCITSPLWSPRIQGLFSQTLANSSATPSSDAACFTWRGSWHVLCIVSLWGTVPQERININSFPITQRVRKIMQIVSLSGLFYFLHTNTKPKSAIWSRIVWCSDFLSLSACVHLWRESFFSVLVKHVSVRVITSGK